MTSLNILYAPEVRLDRAEGGFEFEADVDEVNIRCVADANPEPDIVWRKAGGESIFRYAYFLTSLENEREIINNCFVYKFTIAVIKIQGFLTPEKLIGGGQMVIMMTNNLTPNRKNCRQKRPELKNICK